MGIRVRHRVGERRAFDGFELVELVERDVIHDVHFARAQLVHTGVAARQEPKQDLADGRRTTPVFVVPFEKKILPGPPLLDAIGPRANGIAVFPGKTASAESVNDS